jgi:7-cyano-7-deazaguanine synthase in queuosine biosynthesis
MRKLILLLLLIPSLARAGDIAEVLKLDIVLRGLWAFDGPSPWRIESIVLLRPLNAGFFSRIWAHDLLTMDWYENFKDQPWKVNNKLTIGIDVVKIADVIKIAPVYQIQHITSQPVSQRIGLEVRY